MPDKKGTGKHPHKSSSQSRTHESSGSGGAGTARAMEKEGMEQGRTTESKENKGQHGHSSGKSKK